MKNTNIESYLQKMFSVRCAHVLRYNIPRPPRNLMELKFGMDSGLRKLSILLCGIA